ncbi:uncharacterized protein RJT20DRAFT_148176 [Scheffersomyces xylosifermentans]|uniref:uncharacterized protein n=1 Tax=Scheffersomyces xylosifermentans TaxID=1304137 RepID=UPI00315DAA8F
MFFSGRNSDNIVVKEPNGLGISINPALFEIRLRDPQENLKIVLDTHSLQLRDRPASQSVELIAKSSISVTAGPTQTRSAFLYVTNALPMARYRQMDYVEFQGKYLQPLKDAIENGNIRSWSMQHSYRYPVALSDASAKDIQNYFERSMERTIYHLYGYLCGDKAFFGNWRYRPPLAETDRIEPCVTHMCNLESSNNQHSSSRGPDYCIGLGDFKGREYKLSTGFENMLKDLNSGRRSRTEIEFSDDEWTDSVLFTLILRKYLYQALVSGTNRIFISDYESFSIFIEYEFDSMGQLIIEYYIVNNPETIEHGITLRSAIAGFFFDTVDQAKKIKEGLGIRVDLAKGREGLEDLFDNVGRRATGKSSCSSSLKRKLGGNWKSSAIQDRGQWNDCVNEVHGTTYCRVENVSSKTFLQ